jgi:hypothetical protein
LLSVIFCGRSLPVPFCSIRRNLPGFISRFPDNAVLSALFLHNCDFHHLFFFQEVLTSLYKGAAGRMKKGENKMTGKIIQGQDVEARDMKYYVFPIIGLGFFSLIGMAAIIL